MRQKYKQYSEPDPFPTIAKDRPQWVCWRYSDRDSSKPAKLPLSPSTGEPADVTNPADWSDLTTAQLYHYEGEIIGYRETVPTNTDGFGFVFTADDPYVGVDIDDCVTLTGRIKPWAVDILNKLDCYTEFSPSGTGIHCVCQGSLPNGNARSANLELYEEGRFFTVTTNQVSSIETSVHTPERTDELAKLYEEHIASEDSTSDSPAQPTAVATGGGNSLSDEEVVAKATEAANGDKFARLWAGSTKGYPSHSEADNALCAMLAFWTGGDPQQIDRLFRQSGLYREKWDESRGSQTYGGTTVQNAISQTGEFYEK